MENRCFDYGYHGTEESGTRFDCMVTDELFDGQLVIITQDEERLLIDPWSFTKTKEIEVDFSLWNGLPPASVCALCVTLISEGIENPTDYIKEFLKDFDEENEETTSRKSHWQQSADYGIMGAGRCH